jgi:hypothetical protein
MKTALICFLLILASLSCSYAQNQRPHIISTLQKKGNGEGQVQVIQDAKIDALMIRAVETKAAHKAIRGFRIKIFSDNSTDARQLTNDTKAKLISNFPETETYLEVKAPNWRLYAGNYRTIADAIQAKKQFEKYFRDLIIVEADIDINKL